MPGELVPLVLLPRYTTYAGLPPEDPGPMYFSTVAMDVTAYSSAIVNVWRGKVVGTDAAPEWTFQESTDGVNWTICGGTTAGMTPGENLEVQYLPEFSKRWFRLIVQLGNANNVVSCWAVGFLVERLS